MNCETVFDLASRERELAELEARSSRPDLWNDPEAAQKLLTEISHRRQELEPWRELMLRTQDLATLAELAEEEDDAHTAHEVEREIGEVNQLIEQLTTASLLQGEYDAHDAIISINAGAGGTEACDWVEMLARMYGRWAERHQYQWRVIDSTPGESAGSKSITAEVLGRDAYGYLRAERGVHRLVRISPFDSQKRRHTTFASVDVIPEVEEADEVEINQDELKVETYRATGAGGQHVNKTDSAVRITHLPTGLVASCQNERSQHKNRANALKVLKARLLELQRQEQEQKIAELRGQTSPIEWGHQIRSYVLHPYKMVKDLRTNYETGNADAVLDGEIDTFILRYLEQEAN